ncbi:ABC transporter ATP-binding protein [Hathewaya massiliensis]|uniref:ABC transporter ATP-binding protein n=1 Tax=Hathewaya massiliensis TaxID=1964382 RepID=UPI00115C2538|nr:sn-glycerol-3-phosphate ABC transporter ATP-binding protein UgpC [Hathewaya massiliensis]
MAGLKLINISKEYDNGFKAVDNFNIEIEDKEFIVLVGPSGCGKSTTLRMIAGLEDISSGELYIGDKLVNHVEPKDRDIAMVFQNYALYPHMTVFENMAFGLKLKKKDNAYIKEKVEETAKILGIEELLKRKPKELSGGQRQRVALGRAMVREPKVFLMDEPLSNLDAKLRVQMRTELSKLHQKLKTTFIYVTHDQTEAMTMGSRIVVMEEGKIQQIADSETIYNKPANKFVASFIGSPQMNFLKVNIIEEELKASKEGNPSKEEKTKVFAEFNSFKIEINEENSKVLKEKSYIGKEMILGIRPEDLYLCDSNNLNTEDALEATVEVKEMLGFEAYLYLNLFGESIVARVSPEVKSKPNDKVKLGLNKEKIHLFDTETEERISR